MKFPNAKKKNAENFYFQQTIIAKNNSTVKFPTTSKATPTTIDDIFQKK